MVIHTQLRYTKNKTPIEKASAEDKTREVLPHYQERWRQMPWEKVAFLQRPALSHQHLPQTQEVASFKVQLTGGVCCHHEVGVPLLENLKAEPLGLSCPKDARMGVRGVAGRATAAGTKQH